MSPEGTIVPGELSNDLATTRRRRFKRVGDLGVSYKQYLYDFSSEATSSFKKYI